MAIFLLSQRQNIAGPVVEDFAGFLKRFELDTLRDLRAETICSLILTELFERFAGTMNLVRNLACSTLSNKSENA